MLYHIIQFDYILDSKKSWYRMFRILYKHGIAIPSYRQLNDIYLSSILIVR